MMTRCGLRIALLLAPSPVLAQTAPPPVPAPAASTPTIVVTGRRKSDKAEEQAVRHLTAAVSVVTGGQLARFQEPICVAVTGLPDAYDRIVANRIAADARIVGLPVAKPGCRPNITVMLVDDGRAMLQAFVRQSPTTFADLTSAERNALLTMPSPAHVLTVTETRSRDGNRIRQNPDQTPTLTVDQVSIVDLSTRQDINGVLVLLDIPATIGKSLHQLADYAAMRALARTRDGERVTGDTILTLFAADATAAPPSLTPFDIQYLKALYTGSAVRPGLFKVGEMARGINRSGATASAATPTRANDPPPPHEPD